MTSTNSVIYKPGVIRDDFPATLATGTRRPSR
jgi:hypothetical protein